MPLFEELTTGPIPKGSNLLVAFDPASEWYNAALTIAAGWLESGGRVHHNATVQPPVAVRSQLNRLGLISENLNEKTSSESTIGIQPLWATSRRREDLYRR